MPLAAIGAVVAGVSAAAGTAYTIKATEDAKSDQKKLIDRALAEQEAEKKRMASAARVAALCPPVSVDPRGICYSPTSAEGKLALSRIGLAPVPTATTTTTNATAAKKPTIETVFNSLNDLAQQFTGIKQSVLGVQQDTQTATVAGQKRDTTTLIVVGAVGLVLLLLFVLKK